ncbi:MAG TPA: ATP-dependent helicase HrpB, partial [Iamia sp.]
AARRTADLLGEDVGGTAGYRTRDEDVTSRRTRIEVVTEGILVRRLQRDPTLEGTGLVVLDEVHERSVHTDLALALALDARSALCPDLRLLAMSATLDTGRLAAVLGGDGDPAPVVASTGRTFPIDVRWAPTQDRERLDAHVARVVAATLRSDPGDVLVFLPGAADIRRAASALGRSGLGPDVDVRSLFGSLPRDEQDRALAPSPPGRRRVVLATDIAESSLTVAGVRIVVDAGLARVPRLDPRSGLTRLVTVTASKASADQRAGRAGRTSPGVAVRLWSKVEHAPRPRFATPEIEQVDLAPLALELAIWGAADGELRFLDPPPAAALAEGRALLRSLGAIDPDGRPTDLGRALADLPLHPRLARMVVAGARQDRGWEACLLACLLEERDVLRGRPGEVPVDAAERLRLLADERASHPQADRDAVRTVRRRAAQVARRAGVRRRDRVDLTAAGPLLGLAYPDRLAQARSGRRYRLRNGIGAWVPDGDALGDEPYLVIADVDGPARRQPSGQGGSGDAIDGRVRIAAAVDEADVLALGAADVESRSVVTWDEERDDLRAVTERRLGALVLARSEGRASAGADTTAALADRVRSAGLGVLGWTDAARALQARAVFAAGRRDGWPDLSDAALLADLDDWLAPVLGGARSRRDLERVDLVAALRARLGYPWLGQLDAIAPRTVRLGSGREVPVVYDASGAEPAIHVRAQDLYGTTVHPTVDEGGVPVVVHVLSPARRPVQVTADLPGFWAGSWAEVRKEMAGRYPKHRWPADPNSGE